MVAMALVVRGDVVLPDRILRNGVLGVLDGRIAAGIHPAQAAPGLPPVAGLWDAAPASGGVA